MNRSILERAHAMSRTRGISIHAALHELGARGRRVRAARRRKALADAEKSRACVSFLERQGLF